MNDHCMPKCKYKIHTNSTLAESYWRLHEQRRHDSRMMFEERVVLDISS